ncbi:MAG: HAD-IIIA family hydrolase [Synergistaceae bacterium]|nr:HAD-IIIA family hydrolase [Synergistaceae bacterium]
MMQAVIMAGGKGTRLREITGDLIPKPMVKINGKPILQHQIETLSRQGIKDYIFIIGYLGEKIREYFGNGSAFGVNINYIEEKQPLGTAGAFSLLPQYLSDEKFMLVFGDILFDIDVERMEKFHCRHNALATLFVHPNAHPFDSDIVIFNANGQIERFDSKHNVRNYWYKNCVNAGLYIFNSEICKYVPPETKLDLEKELLTKLIEEGRPIFAYRSPEYVKDVGTVERIKNAEEALNSGVIAKRNLKNKQRAIFLDRDGTVTRKNGLVYQEEQLELETCAAEAILAINASGYLAILITNQPVVARGLCSIEDVEEIHRKLETLLGKENAYLDEIRFCPHHPDKGYPEENVLYKIPCHCRKPDIGMLEDCANAYNIDLKESWIVGDTTVDIQTGKNAGCNTALVLTGEAGNDKKYCVKPDFIAKDLKEAVNIILKNCEVSK